MRRGTTKPITLESSTPKEIEFYLSEPKEGVRTGLVSMLCNMVLRKISAYESAEKLNGALMHKSPDVMLVASDLHDDVFPLLMKVRNHEFWRNPFTVISVIIERDNKQQLEGAMKPGADDVMTAPLAPSGVMDRLERIVFKRLPFIAMPDYIGPDGRREEQRKMKVPVFDVLNTLKDKIEGKTYAETAIDANVATQMQSVQAAQLEGLFFYKPGFICKAILKDYEKRPPHEDVAKRLRILRSSLHKAADIATKGNESTLARTCSGFADKVQAISERYKDPTEEELKLLETLSQAFQMAWENISGNVKPH